MTKRRVSLNETMKIRVPTYYVDLIDRLVADGFFLSREHAIVKSIEEWFRARDPLRRRPR